ncbi:telomere binding protein [Paecilomyces lecythidis]|uniref:Telomere binding protein n=1 Tax=Paecilomyces lecythidis TaxID=3004212 RepID=A0ABR3Y857_9EURO
MDGLLTAVKTVKREDHGLLTERNAGHIAKQNDVGLSYQPDGNPSSPDYILEVLKSKPDHDQLFDVLKNLDPSNSSRSANIDIRVPGPTTALILQQLVSTTVPDHWSALQDSQGHKTKDHKLRAVLLRCLCSIPGISAIVTQLRSILSVQGTQREKDSGRSLVIRDLISVLSALLKPKDALFRIHTDLSSTYNKQVQRQIAWRELTSLIAAGRVLSTAAEALASVRTLDSLDGITWVGEGSSYASWLGQSISTFISKIHSDDQDSWKSIGLLVGRALSLGYTDQLIREIYSAVLCEQDFSVQFRRLLQNVRVPEQTAIFEAVLRDIERKYFEGELPTDRPDDHSDNEVIGGVAAICASIFNDSTALRNQTASWLASGQSSCIQGIRLRRALIAVISSDEDAVIELFTASLGNFGDKFYIKHTPTQVQEANAQVVLLSAGYVNRVSPTTIREISHSSLYLSAVSNRLAASSNRSQFLGMLVGMAISQLVEPPGKRMRFDLEEMESEEAQWYLNLVNVRDTVGSLQTLIAKAQTASQQKTRKSTKESAKSSAPKRSRPIGHTSKIVSIEEIDDSSEESEDEDLIPYEKPDSDPEDSDDDPTLVNRSKIAVPVYIRDLVAALQDTENADRYNLGVTTAPALIRRKAGFGTEVSEHAEKLAIVLIGLQDKYKLPKFHEYKLQSMIALLVALPLRMGRWFSITFFDADISQAERSVMLTALGLSARELAGYGEEDAQSMGLPAVSDTSFPTKKLPSGLQEMYLTDESPVSALTKKLSQASLQPLALDAADALSGPNALKVRTFSSRMEVEKRRQQREEQRKKSVLKDLHKTLTEGFFYPLTGRFTTMMMQYHT